MTMLAAGGDVSTLATPEFWVLVAFLLFMGLLLYYGVPRIVGKMLDDRADAIRKNLDDARKMREDAQALLNDYQRKAAEAEAEAQKIVDQAKREGEALRVEAERKAVEAVARRVKLAEEKIARAERQAVSEVRGAAVDTAEARFNKAQAAIRTLDAQIAVAQANLRAASVSVDQTLIRAPFTGVVLTKNANVGDILTPFSSAAGTTGAVVTMADMSTLEVEADVSETSIAKIAVGQPAEIQLDAYPDLRLAGSVSRIVPTVDRSKATLLVKVKFDETDLRVLPDMSAKIAFLSRRLEATERTPLPALRPEAIVRAGGEEVVFVVEPAAGASSEDGADKAAAGGRVARKVIRTGGPIGDLMRVDGLAPGTRVVISPPPELADGVRVTAKR